MKQILNILREGRKSLGSTEPFGGVGENTPHRQADSPGEAPTQIFTHQPSGPDLAKTFTRKSSTSVRILFLGDTSFGENYQADIKRRGGLNLLEEHGYDYNFAHVDDFLKSADLVIANIETPITDLKDSPLTGKKKWLHWTDLKEAPLALSRHNIHVANLANNHTFDFGLAGFDQTLRVLEQNRLPILGAGPDISRASQPLIVKTTCSDLPFEVAVISAYQFSVLARDVFGMYADHEKGGINPLNVAQLTSKIKELKLRTPGIFVILFLHWGNNYAWRSGFQAEVADDLIKGGADLIIGHGAHMIQEIERRQNRWVVFSIGNFVFNSPGRYEKHNAPPFSFIADLRAVNSNNRLNLTLRLFPIVTDNTLTNYQPRFVTSDEFQLLLSILKNRPCSPIDEKGEIRTGTEDGKPYLELPITEALSANPN
jgi:poly-gamma-glutamate capsule biosynthesis protein CapA/YwtB (metallophosphatase superfamily)